MNTVDRLPYAAIQAPPLSPPPAIGLLRRTVLRMLASWASVLVIRAATVRRARTVFVPSGA